MSPFTPSTPLRATDRQLSTSLDGQAVILDTAAGRYFSLDGVGALVWELLNGAQDTTVETLEAAVLSRYDVEPERCRHDLLALLTDLADKGLVEVAPEEGD